MKRNNNNTPEFYSDDLLNKTYQELPFIWLFLQKQTPKKSTEQTAQLK